MAISRTIDPLGNRNYKGGPMAFVDLEEGLVRVGERLTHRPVILLCVCARLQGCHRLAAAEAMAARYGVTVEHC